MNAEAIAPKRPMPAVIFGLSRDEYDLINRVNWSRLKLFLKSPAHYLHSLTQKDERTDPMVLGDATHVATFEPELFREKFAIWDGGRRAGREWDAFVDANRGRDILTENMATTARTIARAVTGHRTASKYVTGGRAEVTVTWRDAETGLDCKARLDFVADVPALVDLKTTKDASPEAFGRQCWSLGYLGQAAFYSDGFAAATGSRLPFRFVVVESNAPHVVAVRRVTDEQLELGRNLYRKCLADLAHCRATSNYPGLDAGEETDLVLPRWAWPSLEEDMDADSLDFTQTEA